MAWIRDSLGRVLLQCYEMVELAPDSGRKFPIIIAEGTEEEEWIHREPEPTVVIAGQYASNEVLAIEGL